MIPVSPVIGRFRHSETTFAEDQPEYLPLPALLLSTGKVITRWRPTLRERIKILFGGSLFLSVLTFNRPLQPLQLGTEPPDEIKLLE